MIGRLGLALVHVVKLFEGEIWKSEFPPKFYILFCLRPSAKDLGITGVVIVLFLFHLSHFLFKRNLSEKILPDWEIEPGSFGAPAKHSVNWATPTLIHLLQKIIYLN